MGLYPGHPHPHDAMTSFGGSHLLTPTAAAEDVVRSQAETTLNDQKALARTTFARYLVLIRRVIAGNQIASALTSNFYPKYLAQLSDRQTSVRMVPRTYNGCSCLKIEGCPHPAIIDDRDGHAVTVAGMVADWLMMDGVLGSTLECYYNRTCVSLLHHDVPTDIKPLLTSLDEYFSENSNVQMLMDEIMIASMTSEVRFESYYSQCNPAYCAYFYERRFDLLYIFTRVIGTFDWLALASRLLAPLIVSVILYRKNRISPDIATVSTHIPLANRRKLTSCSTDLV